MGIIRNHIDIVGITPEEQLPHKIQNSQVVEYSEVENIFIPKHNPNIKNIYQIVLDVNLISKREVNIPVGRVVVLDGVKKIKINYAEKGHSQKVNIVNLELPYNTFVELPDKKEIGNVNVQIVDAYFELIDNRKIYSHIVYLVNVHYKEESTCKDKIESVNNYEKIQENFEEEVIEEIGISRENVDYKEIKERRLVDIEAEFI
ncbi:hypothetical protein [Clostridium ganghwense]|uniref:DUF3794 domain-containing protein n=1 Tax=Clostridium ganghwense TaxID=312089 RepID=A0ABT4CKF5_9CLOT|nr:hypothetical protein [Clostridium ganghwense]MCY6369531.1 hypothetical protein [Clostridium ganghwense]